MKSSTFVQRNADFVVANISLLGPFSAIGYRFISSKDIVIAAAGEDAYYLSQAITWAFVCLCAMEVVLAATGALHGLNLLIMDYGVANFMIIVSIVNIFVESRALGHTDIPIIAYWVYLSAVASVKIMVPQHPVQFYTSSRILTTFIGTGGLLLLKWAFGYSAQQLLASALPTFLVGALVNSVLAWTVLAMQRRYLDFTSMQVGVPLPGFLTGLTDVVLDKLSAIDKMIPVSIDLMPRGLNMTHSYMVYSISMFFSSWGILQRQSLQSVSITFSLAIVVSTLMGILCETLNVRTIDERLLEQEAAIVRKHMAEFRKVCSVASDPYELMESVQEHLTALFPGIYGCFAVLDGRAGSAVGGKRDSFWLYAYSDARTDEDLEEMTRMPLASGMRAADDKCIQDSALKFGGLSFFDDWSVATKRHGITRALVAPLAAGDRTLGTLHIHIRSESRWPIDHLIVKGVASSIAHWLLFRLATLENKAKSNLLQDLLPSHIYEHLTQEAETIIRENRTNSTHPSASEVGPRGRSSTRESAPTTPISELVAIASVSTAPLPTNLQATNSQALDGTERATAPVRVARLPRVSPVPSNPEQEAKSCASNSSEENLMMDSFNHITPSFYDAGVWSVAPPMDLGSTLHDDAPPADESASGLDDSVIRLMQDHQDVSILFADLVSFQKLTSTLSSEGMMRTLHEIVSAWDDSCLRHDCYKLDIVGDTYMAACNLHQPDAEHAKKILRLGADMIEAAKKVNIAGNHLSVRVGVATGALASGILGRLRRKFTTMGDVVNIAARLEQTATVNNVQAHESTLKAARLDPSQFGLEMKNAEVKGRGVLNTYMFTTHQIQQIVA